MLVYILKFCVKAHAQAHAHMLTLNLLTPYWATTPSPRLCVVPGVQLAACLSYCTMCL